MPRLRAVRTPEEAELVPPTEAVEVVLASDGASAPEPPQKETRAAPAPDDQDNETKALRDQLEKAKNAEKLANEALVASQQREQTAARERDDSRAQSTQHQQQAEEAKYAAVVNALSAAQAESDAATQAWEAADLVMDSKAKAEAQRRLSRAEANLARHEEAKDAYDTGRETRKVEVQPQRSQQADPIEQAIAAMPSGAQTWLRSHPDYLTDTRKNAKLQAVHWDVVDEGHPQFSTAYFEALETHLGLRQKAAPVTEEDDDDYQEPPAPPTRSRAVTSAPPTRDVPSPSTGKPSSTRITLTPEQREMARLSGIDEVSYAKGVMELRKRKAEGHYTERG